MQLADLRAITLAPQRLGAEAAKRDQEPHTQTSVPAWKFA